MKVGNFCNVVSAPICPGMVRRIRAANADLIHIHYPNPSGVLAYLLSGHKASLVITYHSDVVRQRLLDRVCQPILFRALERSAAVIATSQKYVETSPVLWRYRDRCHIIPLGVPIKEFQLGDSAEVVSIRNQYGPRIAITVCRLVYYKGLEYLIRAMGGVRGRLLIVGEGPLRSILERQARGAGLGEKVIFLGQVQDIVPYYHAADVFVLASIARSEAFGIAQLEAMACGKPVINTRLSSGVPFVSLDGVTGITVPPANPKALADAINALFDDSGRRAQYGNAARRRVQLEFSLELMAQRTLQLYEMALRSAKLPASVPARELVGAAAPKRT